MKTFISTYILDKQGELLETKKDEKPLVEKIKDKTEMVFDKVNDYERIKEKLIGETFEYAPQFNYIINGILLRYENNKDLIRFLRGNTGIITNTFMKSGTRNLRILKHALNDFEKIYNTVNMAYPDTSFRVLQTMLIFTIAVSFEIKAGKIIKYKFEGIQNNEEYRKILVSSRVLADNKQFYIKEFDSNYYYNFKSEYRFFKFIEMYVRTRIFDMKIFKRDMEDIISTIDTKKLPGYKRLLTEEYWKISDDEFPKIIDEIIEDIENGKLELVDIIKIFAYFVYFKQKELIDKDITEVKEKFLKGMNKSVIHSKYCKNVQEEISNLGIEISNDFGIAIEELIEYFTKLNDLIYEKEMKKLSENVFKNIPMKMELFYDMFEKECMDIPIFKYYEPLQMFQRITNASNEDIITIGDKLVERARKNKQTLYVEKEFMEKLIRLLKTSIANKKNKIKTVMIESFIQRIVDIIEMYDESSKIQEL